MRWPIALAALCCAASGWAAEATALADQAIERISQGDCKGALDPLNRGLKAGEAKAFYLLGTMFARGVCVTPDVPRGLEHLEIAAKAGVGSAAEELVLIHGLGRGAPQDYARAGLWGIALADISEAERRAESGAPMQVAKGDGTGPKLEPLDRSMAMAVGQAATIQALASERIRSAEMRTRRGGKVSALVVVTSAGPGTQPKFEIERVVQNRSTHTDSNIATGIGEEALSYISEFFAAAIRDVPPLESREAVKVPREFVVIMH